MKQYLKLLQAIQDEGTDKPAARANMPGTRSLFGYQFRHDLADGFPLLTTKKMFWKGVVVELLWFLRGDTNIKYLVDNGCNIWNEDAYLYYLKVEKQITAGLVTPLSYDEFIFKIKHSEPHQISDWFELSYPYNLGDCGEQYGKLWRDWQGKPFLMTEQGVGVTVGQNQIDQIADLIKGLKNSPESRRHILTAWNPATLDQMALNACHVLVQFNCRPLSIYDRVSLAANYIKFEDESDRIEFEQMQHLYNTDDITKRMDDWQVPKYKLDCQLYQRSADSVLGVPFNIASYALLTHIVAKMVNMVPGEFIHTFGDAHIYDNHKEAVAEQLSRTPTQLPVLHLNENVDWVQLGEFLDFESLYHTDFVIGDYHPQPSIKAELKTGL